MKMRQLMKMLPPTNLLVVVLLATVATGCGARKLPGSDIDDTSDTRAVIDVVNAYRHAVEARNPQALIDMVDESFRDDGGSANPDDDLEYKTLFTALPARFLKVQDVKLDVTVRRIEFDDDVTRARVTYSYQMSFRIPEFTSRTQSETDIKQMTLKRVSDKQWKITSGI
jgi:hypothetical protein